ncbi:hypothetical protein H6P81_007113 [Aristolochia fimbriata]|uniref:Uncharacterized protein n=1 Tax=Aristolochia fimbriata TaxID=158543 RepID=A0AAV7F0J0_ARIFI|nr:hypothetical protein H6P81_007113 [Aristolochia fimbriata]
MRVSRERTIDRETEVITAVILVFLVRERDLYLRGGDTGKTVFETGVICKEVPLGRLVIVVTARGALIGHMRKDIFVTMASSVSCEKLQGKKKRKKRVRVGPKGHVWPRESRVSPSQGCALVQQIWALKNHDLESHTKEKRKKKTAEMGLAGAEGQGFSGISQDPSPPPARIRSRWGYSAAMTPSSSDINQTQKRPSALRCEASGLLASSSIPASTSSKLMPPSPSITRDLIICDGVLHRRDRRSGDGTWFRCRVNMAWQADSSAGSGRSHPNRGESGSSDVAF